MPRRDFYLWLARLATRTRTAVRRIARRSRCLPATRLRRVSHGARRNTTAHIGELPGVSEMTQWKVGYIIGSIAKASINRKLAGALVKLAPEKMVMSEIPIAE